MKRMMMVLILALWIPAGMAADHRPVRPEPAVEYHGVGVVYRVEPVIGLLYISHGEVPFAGWKARTQDLKVRPRELAQGLSSGMKIRFQLTAVDSQTYVITALEPVE